MLTEGERSAVPTMKEAISLAIGLKIRPEDAHEAVGFFGKLEEIRSFQSAGSPPRTRRWNSSPSSGYSAVYPLTSSFHSRT